MKEIVESIRHGGLGRGGPAADERQGWKSNPSPFKTQANFTVSGAREEILRINAGPEPAKRD